MFRVTNSIILGPYLSFQRLQQAKDFGVTDVVNVSDIPSQVSVCEHGFQTVSWIAIEDRELIPLEFAIEAMDRIHESLVRSRGIVYIHCVAGWNRSPTVLWLYLVACGIERLAASEMICRASPDAVPGHSLLVDARLTHHAQAHGKRNFLPHPAPEKLLSCT